MLGQTQNPLLQQIEQQMQQKAQERLSPQDQTAFQKVVTAGLNVMYGPQTHALMVKQLQKPGDPTEVVGDGVAALIGLLYNKSKGTMPIPPAMLAAHVLLAEALDFMQKAGKLQLTPAVIAQATQALGAHLMQVFHVNPDQVNQAAKQTLQRGPDKQGIIAGAQQ